jgi:excisionase family DNA binding protein
MTVPTTTAPEERSKILYTIEDSMHLLSLGRTKLYELLRTGRLRSVHEGGSRRISATAIAEYVALLEQEATADR